MRRIPWILVPLLLIGALAALLGGAVRAPERAAASTGADEIRLAVLSPAIAVILDDLGARDRIVGRHAFDIVLDDSVPVVGDMNGIDYERLLRADPTHILIEDNAQETPDRLRTLARQHGWEIRAYPMLALDDIPAATDRLAREFAGDLGRTQAEAWRSEFDALFSGSNPSAGHAGRVLPLLWTGPPGAAGPGSFHAEIFDRLGYELAITEGGPYITIDPEDILRMDPDSIVLLMEGADEDRLEELLGPLARLDLRCVREGRVAVISDDLVKLPATSIISVVREILDDTAHWAPDGLAEAE